jgi:homoserine O-acetyltransferase
MVFRTPLAFLSALCALSISFSAQAQIAPAAAPQQFAQMGDLQLESKSVIRNCAIGYRTLGTLNADRSNAVVFLTWHTGKSEEALSMFGAKGMFDPAPYYVVIIDAIGNGVSCSPSNSKPQHGTAFPTFTVRDMVESQHRLLTEKLGLQHVHAVMGYSMGGMQTFQWMVSHPDFMDVAIPIAGTPRQSSYDMLFWRSLELTLLNEPSYAKGRYKKQPSMAALQTLFMMNATTPEFRVTHTAQQDFEKFFKETAALDRDAADANNWLWQTRAMLAQDVGEPSDSGKAERSLALAAAKVKARVHVVSPRQDHIVNPLAALEFVKLLKTDTTELTVLEGNCGHWAVNCEMAKVRPVVEAALRSGR